MGEDGLNMPPWVSFVSPMKGQFDNNLELGGRMGVPETKPFLPGGGSSFGVEASASYLTYPFYSDQLPSHQSTREYEVPAVPVFRDYVKESWSYQPERFLNIMPTTASPAYGVIPELATNAHHPMQMLQPVKAESIGAVAVDRQAIPKEPMPVKKRKTNDGIKLPKMKKVKKGPAVPIENGNGSAKKFKQPKKSVDVVINGIEMDISTISIPVCSCTGAPQQCYRWGCGGWQSSCCTTNLSQYPLPMSAKRRGARIAGRKMSLGAFKKVLEKLDSEGYDFAQPIDLRTHWAKHGTNKFVTIR